MSEENKGPRKKSDAEKKEEKNAMVNLWMSNLGEESASETQTKESSSDSDKKD